MATNSSVLAWRIQGRGSLVGYSPWGHKESDTTEWLTHTHTLTPVFLPGESQGQGRLVGCCLWGCTESDTTERPPFHFSLSCIGKGNGNPLQCSCLENPRDRGGWWAAVYGVTQSRTWLKWLSIHSADRSTVRIFWHWDDIKITFSFLQIDFSLSLSFLRENHWILN